MSSVINVRLNEKMTLQFVELYRDERILWDKKHESYNKRAERLRAYRRIADGMAVEGMGVPEVASKIKNIRSTYLQELKKIKKLAQRHVQQEDENAVSVQYVPKMLWFPILDAMIGDETVKRIYSLPSAADTLVSSPLPSPPPATHPQTNSHKSNSVRSSRGTIISVLSETFVRSRNTIVCNTPRRTSSNGHVYRMNLSKFN